jgi:signal transduction histidine kinase
MKRKPRLKLSRGARLALLAVIAVLLPVVTLSVIQYRSLMELESKTRAAAQENLRQTLQGVSQGVKGRLENLARETLGTLDLAAVERANLDQLAQQLEDIRRAHAEVDQLFVVSHCSCRENSFALLSTPDRLHRVDSGQFKNSREAQSAIKAYELAQASRPSAGRHSDLFFDHASCAAFPGRETGPFEIAVFFDLIKPGEKKHLGFAGLTVHATYIRETLLPQVVQELLRHPESGAAASTLAFSIFDARGQAVYSNLSGAGGQSAPAAPEVKMTFSPVFRKWELGIGYQGTTIEALARNHFRQNLLLAGFVLALLILGLSLTLRAAARELRLAQAKTTFVSNVSHELKTPLALIRLFAETLELERVKSPEKARDYYRIIHHESRRLTQLINNILDFAKIEAGRREYQFVAADVAEVVTEVLGSYEYQLMSAGFELQTEIAPRLPLAVIDRDALAQAVLNLLNNAVKYSPDTKQVTVRVAARADGIAIEVADRGIGIPRAEQERIFEKFYRVSTGLVHDTKGSGLGLALVKHIVEAHGGRIVVESAPGQGSRFTILLPVQAADAPQERRSEAGGYRVAENPHH